MKAGRYYGPGDIRVENIPEPVLTSDQVKILTVCGSDLHAYLTESPGYGSVEPHPITQETFPVTLGHEFSGTIVETGPGVDTTKWATGTNVIMKGSCDTCSQGYRNLCPHIGFIGITGWGGGLSEYIAVNVRYLHTLPQGISLEIGACVEPLAVAYHAVKRSGFTEDKTALVVGAGPIGLFVVKVLRSLYPTSTILVSEPATIRREFALKHGATQVFDPTNIIIPEAIRSIVAPGVDVAFDAAGIQASMDASLFSLRARGTYVNLAIWEKTATLNVNLILVREINFTGIVGYDRVHEEVLSLIASGKIKGLDELITKRISLDDVVEEGFKKLLSEKDKHGQYTYMFFDNLSLSAGLTVKILVHPGSRSPNL
ncbi:hypothetical protein AGABI1DRAFT_41723 [Agaricus bisporus var. burnettii JB137-S8]|uniref:Enoyl reductase (ER) domain-containing protein n=1 Tax=Agaricus bisporus var. burnettii (strain JB137-S8 / ATCC MYA-4627 / FGSC 10392) TaxID=597362 RepID=K5XTE3_AGABU|nr:uncharacterized protein AGABI1DRAFT_41723 [Agaricus bisporus var. burnettii JB137-S8]EKM78295.1 hypothetical protein AGABI1DRAFT_41723 [Agaricus bisporus var. burnettii JB137-S8]